MKVKIVAVAIIGLAAVGTLYSGLRAQDAPSGTRSVWDGVYTQEQAERGHSLYNRYCASCHGDELAGGDVPPPLAGSGFLANGNGLTVGDLFERIRRSMPQDDPGRLSRQQNADVVAYIFNFKKFPPGKTDFRHDTEVLKQIRIEATKPEPKNDK